MAENKRTFIAHCKWIHVVEKLNNEEAGRLFKHLLLYVNDHHPVAPDRLTELTFEPMRQELKAELVKWNEKRDKFVKAGQASAEARASRKKLGAFGNDVERKPTTLKTDKPKSKKELTKKGIKDVVRGSNDIINLVPFTEEFRPHWQRWLDYKLAEHKTKYKRLDTEQTQFKVLLELSKNNQEVAVKIIERSIANTWKGLFKLENDEQNSKHKGSNQNGVKQTGTGKLGLDFDNQSL